MIKFIVGLFARPYNKAWQYVNLTPSQRKARKAEFAGKKSMREYLGFDPEENEFNTVEKYRNGDYYRVDVSEKHPSNKNYKDNR